MLCHVDHGHGGLQEGEVAAVSGQQRQAVACCGSGDLQVHATWPRVAAVLSHQVGQRPVVLSGVHIERQHLEAVQNRLHALAPVHLRERIARGAHTVRQFADRYRRDCDLVSDISEVPSRWCRWWRPGLCRGTQRDPDLGSAASLDESCSLVEGAGLVLVTGSQSAPMCRAGHGATRAWSRLLLGERVGGLVQPENVVSCSQISPPRCRVWRRRRSERCD